MVAHSYLERSEPRCSPVKHQLTEDFYWPRPRERRLFACSTLRELWQPGARILGQNPIKQDNIGFPIEISAISPSYFGTAPGPFRDVILLGLS